MKFFDYLKDKKFELFIQGCIFIVMLFFLNVLEVQYEIAIVIALLFVCASGIPFFLSYLQRRFFYRRFQKYLAQLDKKYLITELIEAPNFLEGRILYDALVEIDHSMLGNVNVYRLIQKEYKEFIEMWIHEVKTPIAVSKLIIENNPSREMNMLNEELDQIDGYLEQALFYARSQYVEKDYIIRKISLYETIEQVIKRNSRIFITKKVRLEMEAFDVIVNSDSKWLAFIFQQILQNALKYVEKRHGVIKIYTRVQNQSVSLYIEDNGIGIKESELPRVFEKGFTGDIGRNQRASTGIGLYLCKQLCDKLHLDIEVTSIEGTCVRIHFPRMKEV